MAIIAIFSGSYCRAEEVAIKVTEQLNCVFYDDKLLKTVSHKFSVPADRLLKAIYGPTSFFNKITREKQRHVAYMKTVLAEVVQQDNLVIHGYMALLLPDNISHILKVCINADHNYRVKLAAQTEGISEKEADHLIRKDDSRRFQWSQYLTGLSPWEEERYDIMIPMNSSSVDDSANIIIENARKPVVKVTPKSVDAMADFLLATRVNVALTEKNHDEDVLCDSGKATVIINKYVKRLEHKKNELRKIAEAVAGVKEVEIKIGSQFHIPSIYPPEEFEMPQKVLLVDDEKEFVHTLSERLQTRNLESSVVYDGEEALSFIEGEEPEVMVLDLKMPGIDGIEVLRRVKQNHPNTEVIILTGHGSDKEKKLAAELGAFAYLQKPVDIDKLSETMKQAYKKIKELKRNSDDQNSKG